MPKEYAEATEGLEQGPRYKSDATKDLEAIVRVLLQEASPDALQSSVWFFNSLGELEVKINNRTYNLTQILKHNPDFEHLEFTDKELRLYINLLHDPLTFAKPKLFADTTAIPRPSDYEMLDTKSLHSHLNHAEKLALTLYTGGFYKSINDFLRADGQIQELKELTEWNLKNRGREILLAAAIVSHALAKVPPSISVEHQKEEVYRKEIPSAFDQVRQEDIQANKVTTQKGITSTTQTEELINKFKAKKQAKNKSGTIVRYRQPRSLNPMVKNVKELSALEEEEEATTIAGAQIKYDEFSKAGQFLFFEGIPVRTIEGIDPFSYHPREMSLRSELLLMNQKMLASNLGSITREDLSNFKALVEDETKQDSATMAPAFKDFDASMEAMRILDENKELLKHAEYVYTHHLSNAFTETHLNQDDAFWEANGVRIERPNHGLAHTLRVTAFLRPVIDYLAQFAKDQNFKEFCKTLKPELLQQLQLISLFYVTGRESELGIAASKDTYHRYKKAAYKNFKTYAEKIGKSKAEIKSAKKILLGAQELYDNFGKASNEEQYLFNIIAAAHRLDLMRCYEATKVSGEIEQTTNRLVAKSSEQQKASDELLQMAEDTIVATGDRLMSKHQGGGKFIDVDVQRNPELFIENSTKPDVSYKTITKVINKTYPSPAAVSPKSITPSKEDLERLFMIAVKEGHLEMVKVLIKRGVDPTKKYNGELPLFMATVGNHAGVIKALIEAGVNPNQVNEDGNIPLHVAAKLQNLAAIKTLLDAGANPNENNNKGMTPLHVATEKKFSNIIKYLVANGADPTQKNKAGISSIEMAGDDVGMLTAMGPKVRVGMINRLNQKDSADAATIQYLFSTALKEEDEDTIKAALSKGANPHGKSRGLPLISLVIASNLVISVKALLAAGVKLNLADDDYALFKDAFELKQVDMIACLLTSNQVKPNQKFKDGSTPLDHAVRNNLPSVVTLLLEKGADPNKSKEQLLLFAAETNKSEVAAALLKKMDTLAGKDKSESPFAVAMRNKNWDLVALMASGSKMLEIAERVKGDEFLMNGLLKIAVREDHQLAVEQLLASDANPYENDVFSEAVERAEYMRDWRIAITLLFSMNQKQIQTIPPKTLEILARNRQMQIDTVVKMANEKSETSKRGEFVEKLTSQYAALDPLLAKQTANTPAPMGLFGATAESKDQSIANAISREFSATKSQLKT